MTDLLTAEQMRALEKSAILRGHFVGLDLMERAGRGVVDQIFDLWPGMVAGAGRAIVLCGPGNNGGDGHVIARLLHRFGWNVTVFVAGDPSRLPPDARVNYDNWCALGAFRRLRVIRSAN